MEGETKNSFHPSLESLFKILYRNNHTYGKGGGSRGKQYILWLTLVFWVLGSADLLLNLGNSK